MAVDGEIYGEAYFASTYRDYFRQNPPHKLEFYRSIVEQNLPSQKPIHVLDVGCGLGGFLACLRDRDPDRSRFILTGVDVSEFAIATNKSAYPEESFKVCEADRVADLGRTFEVVTAFDVLEHLPDPDKAASAISRCLSEGGLLIFVVPVYDGPLGPVVRLLDKDDSHLQLRSRQWWLHWTARNFKVTGWLGIFRTLTPWHQYVHLPTNALRNVAPAILVTAIKNYA